MKVQIPVSILRRGVKWHAICYTRGSGQYPGGNPNFTGAQPPALLIPCMDGTCQRLDVEIPDELIQHDEYTREKRSFRRVPTSGEPSGDPGGEGE